jgi:hypothetical protein
MSAVGYDRQPVDLSNSGRSDLALEQPIQPTGDRTGKAAADLAGLLPWAVRRAT